jgi:GDP-mannose pyrophosphatase NudK
VLVRQFRIATWVNGNEDGMLIETCAGLLDNDEPEACMRKEAIEETGFEVGEVRKLFELFMSPGGVTELIISLSPNTAIRSGPTMAAALMMKISRCWSSFHQALEMMANGEIRDGKAVILLQYLQTSGLMNGDL